jgi:hypothetical protein
MMWPVRITGGETFQVIAMNGDTEQVSITQGGIAIVRQGAGPQGPQGEQGATGEVGPAGPEGPTGPEGSAGSGYATYADLLP